VSDLDVVPTLLPIVSLEVSESVYLDHPAPEQGGNGVPAVMYCGKSIGGCAIGKTQYAQPACVVDTEP